MLNDFELVMSEDSEVVYPGEVVVLDSLDIDSVTEANLSDAYLGLARLIDLDLSWVLDNLHAVDVASIESTLERTEYNIDDLIAFRTVMEYMGFSVPEYVPSFKDVDGCPVCGSPDDVCDFVDPSVA